MPNKIVCNFSWVEHMCILIYEHKPSNQFMRTFVWREFLSSKGEDNEEIEDRSELKLGDAPMAPDTCQTYL